MRKRMVHILAFGHFKHMSFLGEIVNHQTFMRSDVLTNMLLIIKSDS